MCSADCYILYVCSADCYILYVFSTTALRLQLEVLPSAVAATLFLLSTVCRSALRDGAVGTWVGHSSAYPTEVEMPGAVPPLFTRSVKHSHSVSEMPFL